MNYKDVSKKVRRIANRVLTQDDLEQQIIIQKGSTYQAFGSYSIEETQFGWQVSAKMFESPILFNTAKVALAWCIAHKVGKSELAAELQRLDGRVGAKQFDIDMITHKLDNITSNLDDRAILIARLMEDINNRQVFKKQLAKCVETAKYIKIKGTNTHELNRFNKTSRRKDSR